MAKRKNNHPKAAAKPNRNRNILTGCGGLLVGCLVLGIIGMIGQALGILPDSAEMTQTREARQSATAAQQVALVATQSALDGATQTIIALTPTATPMPTFTPSDTAVPTITFTPNPAPTNTFQSISFATNTPNSNLEPITQQHSPTVVPSTVPASIQGRMKAQFPLKKPMAIPYTIT
ncbi:MAG: hypothetical protein U0694_16620 [Anaerolineae bacterium]